jgi:hypothetical protein
MNWRGRNVTLKRSLRGVYPCRESRPLTARILPDRILGTTPLIATAILARRIGPGPTGPERRWADTIRQVPTPGLGIARTSQRYSFRWQVGYRSRTSDCRRRGHQSPCRDTSAPIWHGHRKSPLLLKCLDREFAGEAVMPGSR